MVRPRGPAPDRDRAYVVIARSMADAHQAVSRLLRAEAAASLVLLAAVAFGARWLGGRAAARPGNGSTRNGGCGSSSPPPDTNCAIR
nr:hypothetical protein [Streptomyces sp. RLB1-33]